MKMKTETGDMLPQVRECLEPLEVRRGKEVFPESLREEHGPSNSGVSNFQPPELQECKFLWS